MNQPSYSYESTARKDANQHPAGDSSSAGQHGMEPARHCAYNQTRERFLSADVDAADFSSASLYSRLPALTADSGAGLWLVPFRGISPTSVRMPVDLVYLDLNCKIVETVESFPLARASASAASSASVLVLPAETICSTETGPGDQLILCPPEEMKRRLQNLTALNSEAAPAAAPAAGPAAGSANAPTAQKDEPVRPGAGRVIQWEDRTRGKNPSERPLVERPAAEERAYEAVPSAAAALVQQVQATPVVEPAQTVAGGTGKIETGKIETGKIETGKIEPGQKPVKTKSWLQKVLGLEPPEPRKAQRESLEGLSAYFFTGGTPMAHAVRDISLTGMYVLTTERWYPGTMVRMTLTDRHEPTVERSITLHAAVMRAGDDGVGLKFVLAKDRRGYDGTAESTDTAQVEQFILRLRG
jgi:hypothetical protein